MKTYTVTLPIAGHIVIEVEAESEKAAIAAALESTELTTDKIETWEALEAFHQGNVCFCPQPWEADAVSTSGEDDEENEDAEAS